MVCNDSTSKDNYILNDNEIANIISICSKYNLNFTSTDNNITAHSIENGCDFIIKPTSTCLSISVPIKNSDYNYNIKFYNKNKGLSYFINMIKYYMDNSFDFTYETTQ